ncbi:MAG: hypothetical protein ACOC6G_02205 [Thermoproteota archaeon]
MRKPILIAIILAGVVMIYSVYSYMNYVDYVGKTVHETDRWTVIKDSKGDIISVETVSDQVWDQLVDLHQNQTRMWIGGVVERYDNTWGFRFKPRTIIIAQITIEAAQSNIKGISQNLDYWIETWGIETYVLARVTKVHE